MSNHTVRAFENNGLLYGALAGLLAAALISGPQLHHWPLWQIFAAFALCAALFGVLGYMAVALAYGALAAGPAGPGQHEEAGNSDGLSGFGDSLIGDD